MTWIHANSNWISICNGILELIEQFIIEFKYLHSNSDFTTNPDTDETLINTDLSWNEQAPVWHPQPEPQPEPEPFTDDIFELEEGIMGPPNTPNPENGGGNTPNPNNGGGNTPNPNNGEGNTPNPENGEGSTNNGEGSSQNS